MKHKSTILLDDQKAERLGVTRQDFQDFFAWDCRPFYIGIVRFFPRTKEAAEQFMACGQTIYSEIRITAPSPETIDIAQKYGYELKKDAAGMPYLTDEQYKLKKRR